jgi:hypothetical protein
VDTSKLSLGEQIAAASGIALIIFLFLPWYGASVGGFSATGTGWESMSFIDILLFLIGLVAVGVPVARMTDSMPEDVPGAMLVLAAGALGVVLVLYRIIDIPNPDVPDILNNNIDYSRKIGVFLGLIATAGIAYGGWRSMEESPVGSTPSATPPPPPPPPEPPATEPPAATS